MTAHDGIRTDLETTADAIDRTGEVFGRGIISPRELVDRIGFFVGRFLSEAIASAAEVQLIVDYGRAATERLVAHTDPVLIDYYEAVVAGASRAGLLETHLALMLEPIEIAAGSGDSIALERLAELCRFGDREHRWLMSLGSAATTIVRTAHRIGAVEALHDAVSPRYAGEGQIAAPDRRPDVYVLALDLLAHLAADPLEGTRARRALLDLAGYVETGAAAAVRLPVHLLDDEDRAQLLQIHETRVELFAGDEESGQIGLNLLRDNRVVRGAVWQALDAGHL